MDRDTTNRDLICMRNEYDVLVEMNNKLRDLGENMGRHQCVMDILPNVLRDGCAEYDRDCELCIQSWLNEKAVRS